jgi:hypothetical protein
MIACFPKLNVRLCTAEELLSMPPAVVYAAFYGSLPSSVLVFFSNWFLAAASHADVL